jgi:hypothetical protein
VAELTPEQLQAILDKLDAVSRQAQELQRTLRQKMAEQRRGDQQNLAGQPERRKGRRDK